MTHTSKVLNHLFSTKSFKWDNKAGTLSQKKKFKCQHATSTAPVTLGKKKLTFRASRTTAYVISPEPLEASPVNDISRIFVMHSSCTSPGHKSPNKGACKSDVQIKV
jgi:hypothetical protein